MPRQPFLPVYRAKPTTVGLDVATARLATLIGQCSEAWTHVDLQLALAMGSLLGVENKASVAVFTSLRNSRAQRDALQAAAKVSLDDNLKRLFDALMSVHRTLDSQRNDIVHGIWGRSDAIEDAAIWVSLQDHAASLITDYHALRSGASPPPGYDRAENMTKCYFVWKYDEIETVIGDIRSLARAIGNFHGYLRYRDQPAGAHAMKELCAEPLVQKELDKKA